MQAEINGKLTNTMGCRQGALIYYKNGWNHTKNTSGLWLQNGRQKDSNTDDDELIAETEDDLQRRTHIFNTTNKKYNRTISAEKIKCMTK